MKNETTGEILMTPDYLAQNLLVQLQPGLVALAVRVLQPEEPDLPQPYRFHHLSNMIFEPFSNLLCMFT